MFELQFRRGGKWYAHATRFRGREAAERYAAQRLHDTYGAVDESRIIPWQPPSGRCRECGAWGPRDSRGYGWPCGCAAE